MNKESNSTQVTEHKTPNRKGREGNPISLAPLSFDEAVRKMLANQPTKTEEKAVKPPKKATKRKA
jgi:hypothetical protein